MPKPNAQTVVSISTLVLFLAAIGVWIANGGIGRIREAGGSHAGGAGAYTETWTADAIYGFARCANSVGGASFADAQYIVAEFPRIASTDFLVENPRDNTTALPAYGGDVNFQGAAANPWRCRVNGEYRTEVTKWTVTGHINP